MRAPAPGRLRAAVRQPALPQPVRTRMTPSFGQRSGGRLQAAACARRLLLGWSPGQERASAQHPPGCSDLPQRLNRRCRPAPGCC